LPSPKESSRCMAAAYGPRVRSASVLFSHLRCLEGPGRFNFRKLNRAATNLIDRRIIDEDGPIYKSHCGYFCLIVFRFGVCAQSLLASFHGICRSQSFTVRIYKMVFDGKYSGQIGSSQKHLISGCGLAAFRENTLGPLQQSSPQPRWAGFPFTPTSCRDSGEGE